MVKKLIGKLHLGNSQSIALLVVAMIFLLIIVEVVGTGFAIILTFSVNESKKLSKNQKNPGTKSNSTSGEVVNLGDKRNK